MHGYTLIVLVLLIAYSLYRRVRRTVGYQRMVRSRLVTRVTLFAVIGVLVLASGFAYPATYAYDAIGVMIGAGISYYAIRTTSFEWRSDSWYYRPHPWIGVLLIVLFVGRIGLQLYQDAPLISGNHAGSPAANQAQLAAYAHDPTMTAVLFILISYYAVYYAFLIRKEKSLEVKHLDIDP